MDLLESAFAPSLTRLKDCTTHGHDFSEIDRERAVVEKFDITAEAAIKEASARGYSRGRKRFTEDVYHDFDRVTEECRFCGEERTSEENPLYSAPNVPIEAQESLDALARAIAEEKYDGDRRRVERAYVVERG